MRQGFYIVVLLVALAGQVSGAVEALHIPFVAAIPAVGALELGGIVVLANADVRRRLGERANASRLLSAAIAAGAVAFNWLAHADHLLGGFFAGMSALGYLVWLMHTENQRRDRLRATGQLAAVVPAYEVVGHWLAHPWITRRARALAKADADLGLYDSLAHARAAVRRERRQAAIAKVLHRKIRAAVDPVTADIAVHTYDLGEVAARLAAGADYDGLTALIGTDLEPARLAPQRDTDAVPDTPAELIDGALMISHLGVPITDIDPALLPVAVEPAGAPEATPATRADEPAPTRAAPATAPAPVERSDEELRALLEHPSYVPRGSDGTVPVRRAARRLGIGHQRAKRLLSEVGVPTPGGDQQAAPDPAPTGEEASAPA
jgi:hypothetical protein